MQRIKKILVVALCCVVLCFDAGSSYVYAADVSPAYSRGKIAWDGVAWALLSALGIATGEATGAVDYLTENVWTPLVAHLKEKYGSMCDVFIDKTNNKSYVSKDMMQDTLDWGIENNLWDIGAGDIDMTPIYEKDIHHFFNTEKFINYLNGKELMIYGYGHPETKFNFNSENFLSSMPDDIWKNCEVSILGCPIGGYAGVGVMAFIKLNSCNTISIQTTLKNSGTPNAYTNYDVVAKKVEDNGNVSYPNYSIYYYRFNTESKILGTDSFNGSGTHKLFYGAYIGGQVIRVEDVLMNIGTGETTPAKDYAIDSGLTVPQAGEKIDDWLAAQDKVNGGSVGLLGNDVAIPSDVTGTGAAIDSLPLTIPSFADLVINGQLSIDDVLSQGLVKANTGAIADTQSAAGAVAGAEDVAATGENAEANAISVDQAQTALKNLMQQGIDYIAIEIPNNFWNKIPFSIPYDIYLLIHGIFVGSSGGSKKAPRREASSGSNMPVGDPSNVGIEIDIPTVPLKYTEEKTEDTPPNFTFTLNIPYTTPSGETANFNKEFTIETARYNYFAKIIKFSIGLLWLSSVFQWLLAIFSKG